MKNKSFISSFKYAIKGLVTIIREERNFRFDLFPLLKWERVTVYILCALCLSLEAVNSAIERIVDFISPDFHSVAGSIKDISAAAVTISAVISAIIGLYIFVPYAIDLLMQFLSK